MEKESIHPSTILRLPSSSLWYNLQALGRVRRGRDLRTPSGPEGSSGKETTLGAAGFLPGCV